MNHKQQRALTSDSHHVTIESPKPHAFRRLRPNANISPLHKKSESRRLFDLLHPPVTDTPDFSSQQSRCPRTREKYVFRTSFSQGKQPQGTGREKLINKLIPKQPLPRQVFVWFFSPDAAIGEKKNLQILPDDLEPTANSFSFFCA